MKNTSERIIEYLNFKGISKFQFYQTAGLSNGFLDKTANPGADKLDKILSAYPDLNLYWLVGNKGSMIVAPETAALIGGKTASNIAPNAAPNAAPKPQVLSIMPRTVTVDVNNKEVIAFVQAKAAAGYLNGYADPEFIEQLPVISVPGMAGYSHRAFEVRGSSMLPIHHSGSIAIGRAVEELSDIRDRRVYIVVTKSDGVALKRVLNRIKQDGKLIMMSDNDNKSEHPNYPVDPEEILEMWYWRGSFIRESPEPGNFYSRFNDIEARLTLVQSNIKQLQASERVLISGK